MIVCARHRVSDRDILRAVQHGCAFFEPLQGELRVASGCGAGDDCARETFDAHRTQVIGQAPPQRRTLRLALVAA